MPKLKIYKVRSNSRNIEHSVQEFDDGRFSCTCEYYQFKGIKDPVGICSHIKKVILHNKNKIIKLEEILKFEKMQYEICLENPTETPQFYNALEKSRIRIQEITDKLNNLKKQYDTKE